MTPNDKPEDFNIPWIPQGYGSVKPSRRKFSDAIVESKICFRAGVPTFAEILLQMDWVQRCQPPALCMRRIQPPDNSIQHLKQSR